MLNFDSMGVTASASSYIISCLFSLTCAAYQERDVKMRKLGGFPKCHFFNTFFVNKLYK